MQTTIIYIINAKGIITIIFFAEYIINSLLSCKFYLLVKMVDLLILI